MLASWRFTPCLPSKDGRGILCRAAAAENQLNQYITVEKQSKRKVLIVGSGWAGLGAAHHLCKQEELDVTVLEGGYEFGPKNKTFSPDDVGVRGFWYPYKNIFKLVEELELKPFTKWMSSAIYSEDGLEVKFPIFQDTPPLPTPLGPLLYTKFTLLQPVDLLSSIPLMAAVIDFDNTDTSWNKYDQITARELLRQFGCSERLYRCLFDPILRVGLFAPGEQCSAAATLGMLYYFGLAHQKHFDMVLCQGTVKEKIFEPWMDYLKLQGCKFLEGRKVTDLSINVETDSISEVICGKESLRADAVILAIGISSLQEIIQNSAVLCRRPEFLKVLNLETIDLLTVKLQFDGKVRIPNAINISSRLDDSTGWSFFDLNTIQDEYRDDSTTIEIDFYHANDMLPLPDELIVKQVTSFLSKCIKDFENVTVVDKEIRRFPQYLTHFFPGSYKYMMGGSTSFSNLFMAGDWIMNRHGSWFQEKSLVTGMEAANRVIDYLEMGSFAKITAVEEDEPHIQVFRNLNRNLDGIRDQLPCSNFFLP